MISIYLLRILSISLLTTNSLLSLVIFFNNFLVINCNQKNITLIFSSFVHFFFLFYTIKLMFLKFKLYISRKNYILSNKNIKILNFSINMWHLQHKNINFFGKLIVERISIAYSLKHQKQKQTYTNLFMKTFIICMIKIRQIFEY